MRLTDILPHEPLTAREQQIVQRIAAGQSYKAIAEQLAIAPDTVRSHVRAVYQKLQINSKSALIAYALKQPHE
ncbi:response regulator transcription factor [Hymenobacter rubidus]|uniref:response regulator transcription factor n=1 Tax=Hymenobacter rubidus TaxID=1441626 RepID=UPI00191DD602|nr:helix-turn-helix transcriptional regulator [Hymenobacter rubidus]